MSITIKDDRPNGMISFRIVDVGEYFLSDNTLYYRFSVTKEGINCLKVVDGTFSTVLDISLVEQVDVEIRIVR